MHLGLKEDLGCGSFLLEVLERLGQTLVVEEEFCLNSLEQPLCCLDFWRVLQVQLGSWNGDK